MRICDCDDVYDRVPFQTYIINDNVNWAEFKRMFNNIGWNGIVPDQYEQVQLMDDKLYEIISIMIKKQINPSKIRDKQTFIDELDEQCYNTHKQYIDDHLLTPHKMQPMPMPMPAFSQCHMILVLYPNKCNKMEAQLSAFSHGM